MDPIFQNAKIEARAPTLIVVLAPQWDLSVSSTTIRTDRDMRLRMLFESAHIFLTHRPNHLNRKDIFFDYLNNDK